MGHPAANTAFRAIGAVPAIRPFRFQQSTFVPRATVRPRRLASDRVALLQTLAHFASHCSSGAGWRKLRVNFVALRNQFAECPAMATSARHAVTETVQNQTRQRDRLRDKGNGTLRNICRSSAIWMITLCSLSCITGWAVWTFVLNGSLGQDWIVFHHCCQVPV